MKTIDEMNFLLFHRIVKKNNKILNNEDIDATLFITILDLIQKYNENKFYPKHKIILTFDDGNESDYIYALKELKKRNLYSYFFIIPKLVGTRNFLDWNMIKELRSNKMIIGSHSFSHKSMTSLDIRTTIYEMEKSKDIIENKLNEKINSFSFPYGNFDTKLIIAAKKIGYRKIFTSKHGISKKNDFYFKRNSFNKFLKLGEIKKILIANKYTRLNWFVEDFLKYSLKKILPDKEYLRLRKILLNR